MKKILLAGGTGLIGKEIISLLDSKPYEIHVLSRSEKQDTDTIKYHRWDTNQKTMDLDALKVDIIINLAGAGIADKKWSAKRKKVLIDSRVNSALTIKENLQKLPESERPSQYISASAIGYYGDSGDKLMTEKDKTIGNGFLAECTQKWELAAKELTGIVDKICLVRIGIVLSKDGGAFEKMLIPFKFRMASYFGDGSMNYSWIHIEDMAKIFIHIMEKNLEGTYNATAPQVVTNKELTREIKDAKKGFYLMNPVPTAALRLAMGEMADVVLTSNNVSSEKIIQSGYKFTYPDIKSAMKDLVSS